MRDANKVVSTVQSLRAAGYQIDVRALAVNALFSQQGILQRYEEQKADRGNGRMTTPKPTKRLTTECRARWNASSAKSWLTG